MQILITSTSVSQFPLPVVVQTNKLDEPWEAKCDKQTQSKQAAVVGQTALSTLQQLRETVKQKA